MATLPFPARDRAELYANAKNLTIDKRFGWGFDGTVFGTDTGTAIKVLNHQALYRNELDVYLHPQKKEISSLSGFQIPKLVDHDPDYWIIEMTVVSPPYVVDFAGARLKRPEPFDEEIIAEWTKSKREEFGDDWPSVKRLMFAFETRGVFLMDVHPKNVACR